MKSKHIFQTHFAISYNLYQILTMYIYADQLYQLSNIKLADLWKGEIMYKIILWSGWKLLFTDI